jgi:hypothetical protein
MLATKSAGSASRVKDGAVLYHALSPSGVAGDQVRVVVVAVQGASSRQLESCGHSDGVSWANGPPSAARYTVRL